MFGARSITSPGQSDFAGHSPGPSTDSMTRSIASANAFRGMELRYRSSTELVIWMISLDLFMPVPPFCIRKNCYGRLERPHLFMEFLPALFRNEAQLPGEVNGADVRPVPRQA